MRFKSAGAETVAKLKAANPGEGDNGYGESREWRPEEAVVAVVAYVDTRLQTSVQPSAQPSMVHLCELLLHWSAEKCNGHSRSVLPFGLLATRWSP